MKNARRLAILFLISVFLAGTAHADALITVQKFAKDAIYYRYTDKYLNHSVNNPHAKDLQPGFGAEWIEHDDNRYSTYGVKGNLAGVKYEQMSALHTVAIDELRSRLDAQQKEIDDLKKQIGPH